MTIEAGTRLSRRDLLGGSAATLLLAGSAQSRSVRAAERPPSGSVWVATQEHAPWRSLQFPAAGADGNPDVILRPERRYQRIEGFGGCFNELGWDALMLLSPRNRGAAIDALFTADGANLTMGRMPIGANDFARDWYSYDETPGDFALDRFSIARDRTSLIPFITEAMTRRPDLRLWASPWSPPSWMKVNGHYAGLASGPGQPANGLAVSRQGAEGTDMFIQRDAYLDAYARYFARFITAYRDASIRIGTVMPQNEFNSAQIFPSCTWTAQGLARFIPYLGRALAPLDVDILFGTLERPNEDLFELVYRDPEAGPLLKGVGAQWAGKGAVPWIHHAHPDLPIWQTEQECGDGRNDWRYCRYAWSLMKHYLLNGTTAYFYWNLALKAGGVSHWGWAQNSLVSVDPASRTARFNPEYYLLKHVSHFVLPEAQRIEAESWRGYENQLAFANPDGSVVLIIQNDMATAMPVTIQLGDAYHRPTLPPDSFNTLRFAA